ncbi:DUF7112 family protein [Haloarcula sp. GH36]|uniref:DUF7112 family protein n=1 Tax=Haloarcula montana TaxID=3111776 RepID=UPI002D7756CE|nr:hypothetical protein [Haloarcula sp. GH36]
MPDRIPSDHDAVETHRVPVESIGRTDRPRVPLPDAVDLREDDVIALALDGDQYYARVETTFEGDLVLTRAGDNRRVAREGDGQNRLAEWIADTTVSYGGSAHLDVVTAGQEYGLRTPGTRTVYTVTGGPEDSLSDIASDLDG